MDKLSCLQTFGFAGRAFFIETNRFRHSYDIELAEK